MALLIWLGNMPPKSPLVQFITINSQFNQNIRPGWYAYIQTKYLHLDNSIEILNYVYSIP